MGTRKQPKSRLPAGVKRLRDRIERWRRTRTRRTAMPAELWSAATALAQKTGRPYAISRGVRINFDTLKRRMAETKVSAAALPPPSGPAFVEVTGAQLLGAAPSVGPIVELSDEAAGIRVTVRLAPETALDVAGLISAFRPRGDA